MTFRPPWRDAIENDSAIDPPNSGAACKNISPLSLISAGELSYARPVSVCLQDVGVRACVRLGEMTTLRS